VGTPMKATGAGKRMESLQRRTAQYGALTILSVTRARIRSHWTKCAVVRRAPYDGAHHSSLSLCLRTSQQRMGLLLCSNGEGPVLPDGARRVTSDPAIWLGPGGTKGTPLPVAFWSFCQIVVKWFGADSRRLECAEEQVAPSRARSLGVTLSGRKCATSAGDSGPAWGLRRW
jgi:hypothetical protein